MRTRTAKWGNSIGVRLPRALVDEMAISPGQTFEVRRDGTRIEIETRPHAPRIPYYRLEDLVAQMKPENAPPLVDWGPDRGAEIIEEDEYSRGEITFDDLIKGKDAL